ncbi:MAG: TonB-dependent receptor [Gemmatimonadales bacterium]|nr:TonB-dependent receptor [Gemmatimonadales bacterium]
MRWSGMMGRLAAVALALMTAAPAARAQQAGTIEVRVVKAQGALPVPEATVEVIGQARRATTSAEGRALLTGVAPGIVRVRVSAIGFEPQVQTDIPVSPAKPATLLFTLREAPVQLGELEAAAPRYFAPADDAQPSLQSLGAEEVRRAPGVQEDVVRSVALLPGVGVTTGGRNDLVVRGGAPVENLFLVDNLEVPNINHFGSQGSTGGPISLINIDLVQDVTFSTGGFDVRFGDRTASVTNLTLREGNEQRLAGELNLAATGFAGNLEGPLGRSGNFIASLRRSYLDLIFSAVGFNFIPTFWDLQFKTVQRLDRRNTLSFLAIGALNDLSFNNDTPDNRFDNRTIPSLDQTQYFSGLTWKRAGEASQLTVTLGRTFTRFATFQNDTLLTRVFENRSSEGENSLRAEWLGALGPRVDLNVGTVTKFADGLRYDLLLPGDRRRDELGVPRPLDRDTAFSAFRTAGFASLNWRITDRLRLSPGLRADWYAFLGNALRVSPRLAVTWAVDDRTALTASAGRFVQAPSFIWLAGDVGNGTLQPWTADQAVLGIQRQLRPDVKLQVEAYAKRYADYPVRLWRPNAVLAPTGFEDVSSDIPFGLEPLRSTGDGRAFGAELFVQKKLSDTRWFGLLSASVNRTQFRALDGAWRDGPFDTRLIGTALLGWRPNPRWELATKFRAATGRPYTPFVAAGPLAGTLDFGRYNAERVPVFHALDVRVDRRWTLGGSQLIFYVDVQNIYGRRNIDRLEWNPRLGAAEFNTSLGVFPSIGLNLEF